MLLVVEANLVVVGTAVVEPPSPLEATVTGACTGGRTGGCTGTVDGGYRRRSGLAIYLLIASSFSTSSRLLSCRLSMLLLPANTSCAASLFCISATQIRGISGSGLGGLLGSVPVSIRNCL